MAGRIPREFIDELLQRVDIVDVVNGRVPLKKVGKDYQARCPFHDEKTPSFTVSPDKQFYHCFGCGAHGSVIGFLMDFEHLGFLEAVDELASRAGLEVPHKRKDDAAPAATKPLYDMLQRAAEFYRQQLGQHPLAQRAIAYLQRRGLSGEIAARFAIGYAPPGWDNLMRHLNTGRRSLEHLHQTGLLAERPGSDGYDRLRDRIVFPIRDQRGRVVGFGGRVLDGESKPKYLNSPETPVFHKGSELYGLYEARKQLRKIERLLIVEGYLDVIALAQQGIAYAVATLGTATTEHHLERLFRYSSDLVFCFDGDRAGRAAAWKALNLALPVARDGREIRFLFLPEGEDPDTLVRAEGAAAFEKRLRHASPLSELFFDRIRHGIDMDSLDGRARFAAQARPLLAALPAGLFREMMFTRLAGIVGLDRQQIDAPPQRPPSRRRTRPAIPRQRMTPVRRAIMLLLQNPELGIRERDLPQDWRQLSVAGIELLKQLLELTQSRPNLNTASILERWRGTETGGHLEKLAVCALPVPDAGRGTEFDATLEQLNAQWREQQAQRLYSRPRPSQMTDEEKRQLKEYLNPHPAPEDAL